MINMFTEFRLKTHAMVFSVTVPNIHNNSLVKCFKLISATRLNQLQAEQECRRYFQKERLLGKGHLTSINSYQEYAFVSSIAYQLGFSNYWIGLHKKVPAWRIIWNIIRHFITSFFFRIPVIYQNGSMVGRTYSHISNGIAMMKQKWP